MANKHANLNELFTAIANAIRIADDSVTGNLVADDFPDIIANIETGIDTTETVNPAGKPDIRSGKIAYVNGTKVTGDMPDISLNAPTISVGSDGVITAKVTQSTSGYLTATSNQATKSLSTQNGGEFTPTTSLQTIVPAQTYCLGDIKIKAMPTVSHANPQTPTLDTTNKKIVAKHTQPVGYIATQTTTEATASINMVNGGNTITPTKSTQTAIAASTYAINAIQVGAIPSTYKRVYKNTYSISETSSNTDTITVSGIGFTPTGCAFMCQEPDLGNDLEVDGRRFVIYAHNINGSANCGVTRWRESTGNKYLYGYQGNDNYVRFTFSSGTCKFSSSDHYLCPGVWEYVIWE